MTVVTAKRRATGRPVPSELSPTGKLVYLYLREHGRASAADLKSALDLPQIKLYPVLAALERNGFVETDDGTFLVS